MIRDKKTNALINDDLTSLNKYKIERDRSRKLEYLSKEVSEIRNILNSICEKLENIESR